MGNEHKTVSSWRTAITGKEWDDTPFVAVQEHVIDQEKCERYLSTQQLIAQLLLESTTTDEVYPKILETLCRLFECDFGDLRLIDQQENLLQCSSIWHFPPREISQFNTLKKSSTLSPAIDFPGHVLSRNKPVWIPDVARDKNIVPTTDASKECLRGAVSVPIQKDGKIFGTLCFYSHRILHADKVMLSLLSSIGNQIGHFIKRKRAEITLKESGEKYRRLIENLQDNYFFYSHNIEGVFTYISPSITNILGFSPKEFLTHFTQYLTDNPMNHEVLRYTELSIKGLKQPPYKVELFDKDGHKRMLKVQEVPVFDSNNKVIAVDGIARDITEQIVSEKRIHNYQRQLKALSSSLSLAEERERRQIAGNLHDRIGHYLIATKMKLDDLVGQKRIDNHRPALSECKGYIEKTIQDIRTLTFELSPPVLYKRGFEPAVQWFAEYFQKQHNIRIDFVGNGRNKPMDDDMRALLFRSIQELLFNILKHAKAKRGKVSIINKNNNVVVHVEDNGVGFDTQEIQPSLNGFGLFSIRERLDHLGGCMVIESRSGFGTRVTLKAPLTNHEVEATEEKKVLTGGLLGLDKIVV